MTNADIKWLTIALEHGYEHPFNAMPNRSLNRLQNMGLLDRNPCSGPGRLTQWRPTAKALDEYELV